MSEFNTRILREVLPQATRQHTPEAVFETFGINPKNGSPFLQQVLEFVKNNYLNICSVSEVADYFLVSQGTLSTRFNQECSTGLKNMIISLKLEHARCLMKNKGLSLKEIARLVGFSNPIRFNEQFRKKYGISPGKYRLNQGTEEKRHSSGQKCLVKRKKPQFTGSVIYSFE